jgi:hypothetical protein
VLLDDEGLAHIGEHGFDRGDDVPHRRVGDLFAVGSFQCLPKGDEILQGSHGWRHRVRDGR